MRFKRAGAYIIQRTMTFRRTQPCAESALPILVSQIESLSQGLFYCPDHFERVSMNRCSLGLYGRLIQIRRNAQLKQSLSQHSTIETIAPVIDNKGHKSLGCTKEDYFSIKGGQKDP